MSKIVDLNPPQPTPADDLLEKISARFKVMSNLVTYQAGLPQDGVALGGPELNDVQLRHVERGGDVTVHEPGQLVGYPIIDLKRHRQDLHWYLRQIEEALIVALGEWSLVCCRRPGQTGVWIADRKLASIGVHARDWVTSHGFALNAHNDLTTFNWIVPCGIAGVPMIDS